MDQSETRYHNKSDKPDNLIKRDNEILDKCSDIEDLLPKFMKSFFVYLKTGVLPMSRLAYLGDIQFFCHYLINETGLTQAEKIRDISVEEFNAITAKDINIFIGDYCTRYKIKKDLITTVYENGNRSLARKKSSISVLFKFLYRDSIIKYNITDSFNPIRLPKPGEKEIKSLEQDEVMRMLDAAQNGEGLTKKELDYWKKTKKRDRAILVLFVTYGLRLYELQHLNISSFNFSRGDFKIYRKRGKETSMPLNKSVQNAVQDYINNERAHEDKLQAEYRDALFLSLQGTRITERAIRELVRKYTSIGMATSRSAGYSPHKLRATAATALIEQGNSIFDVQGLLDHENVTTTQLYAAHKKHAKQELIKNFEWLDDFDSAQSQDKRKEPLDLDANKLKNRGNQNEK